MFRKFTQAALAVTAGMVIAATLTSGQHTRLSDILDGLLPQETQKVQPVQSGRQSAKKDRPTFTTAIAQSAR